MSKVLIIEDDPTMSESVSVTVTLKTPSFPFENGASPIWAG